MATEKNRCSWCLKFDQYIQYHDEEWGVPVHDDTRLFEFLILEGAQAGLSWTTVLKKRDRYRELFDNFHPEKVATYGDEKVAVLLADPGIVRNRLKVASAVTNAQAFLRVQEEFGSFDAYVWRFTGGDPKQNAWQVQADVPARTAESDALSKDLLKRGFRFAGTTNLQTTELTVALAATFNTYFQSAAAADFGGQFTLTIPFTIQGDTATVNSVTVVLTNGVGSSQAVTATF